MNSQPTQTQVEAEAKAKQAQLEASTEPAGAITPTTPPPIDDQPWRQWVDPVLDFLAKLPDYIGQFFSDYKQPLLTLGLFFAGIVTVKVSLAVLDALNDIPLLSPLLQLVGIGYTGWFVYRYLLRASTRQELAAEFNALKQQVVGEES